MSATALLFERDTHRYSVGGRELISVTQALTEAGLVEARWFTEYSALRGTLIHEAVLLDTQDDLDEDTLDPTLRPYFEAYRRFRVESGFEVQACEARYYDGLVGYAGTLDLLGRFPHDATTLSLIDIKSGSIPGHVGYQTAAYRRLLKTSAPVARWCLNLRADGTYRLQQLTSRHDDRVFLAAVTIAQAKRGLL